jgi:hypothetical protein
MSKNVVAPGGHKWRHKMAHTRCMVDKATRTRTPTHSGTRKHERARTVSQTHTHTHKYVILTAFSRQHWIRERPSLLRYPNIGCPVNSDFFTKGANPSVHSWIVVKRRVKKQIPVFVSSFPVGGMERPVFRQDITFSGVFFFFIFPTPCVIINI